MNKFKESFIKTNSKLCSTWFGLIVNPISKLTTLILFLVDHIYIYIYIEEVENHSIANKEDIYISQIEWDKPPDGVLQP